jgi:hypothetical protein
MSAHPLTAAQKRLCTPDDENGALARVEAACVAHPEMDFPRDGIAVRILLITSPYSPNNYK